MRGVSPGAMAGDGGGMPVTHAPRVRRAGVVLMAAGCVLSVSACNGIPPEPSVVAQAANRTPSAPPALSAAALQPAFDQFLAAHPGEITLAWAPVAAPEQVQVLGATTDTDAWSTIKVPISIAAMQAAPEKSRKARLAQVSAAIEWSDNTAAARLYRSLGSETEAAQAVEAVLRAGGDQRTKVGLDADGRREGFGRTVWRVEDSAVFAAHLPCLPQASVVFDEMGKIGEDHRWGLGSLTTPVHFKGGWGPSDHGYLLRQLGTIDHHDGRTGVAFIIKPADGTHETAAATASALATLLADRLGPADGGTCPVASTE